MAKFTTMTGDFVFDKALCDFAAPIKILVKKLPEVLVDSNTKNSCLVYTYRVDIPHPQPPTPTKMKVTCMLAICPPGPTTRYVVAMFIMIMIKENDTDEYTL